MRVVFKTTYDRDIDHFEEARGAIKVGLLVLALAIFPFFAGEYYLAEATNTLIWSLAGLGLMLLVGHTGQVSLGHAAFLAIGAYADAALMEAGLPFALAFPLAGLIAGAFGALIAIPSTRMSGIYLAIATLALAVLVEEAEALVEAGWVAH